MTLRTTRVVLGLVLLVFSSLASALGLGPIKMNSAMNEPMDAEIAILNLGDLAESEIQVKLASVEDFKQAGVDRVFHLVDLRFAVDLSNPSRPVVRVTSHKAIKEPYLDFIVEVRWTSGRMLREYTVLMDLPVFAQEKPGGKQVSASRGTPSSKPVVKPVVKPAVKPAVKTGSVPTSRAVTGSVAPTPSTAPEQGSPAQVSRVATSASATGYTVVSGDTLWNIATRNASQGTTVQQTIMAIHKRNPDAFINDNINLVRKGAVLRLPDAEAVRAMTQEQALSQLKSHANAWRELAPSASANETAAIEAVDANSVGGNSPSAKVEEGRLRLMVASDGSGGSGNGSGNGTGTGGADIETQFAVTQEELERTNRENAELKEKVASLEEQVDAMSRLVELEDSSLRGAQLAAEAESDPSAEGEESEVEGGGFSFSDIVADETPVTDSEASGSSLETSEGQELLTKTPETVPEVAPQPAENVEQPTQATAPVQVEQGLMGKATSLLDSIKGLLIPLVIALLVIGGMVFMLIRRRDSGDEAEFGMIEPDELLASSASEEVSLTGSVEEEIELDQEDLLFAEAAENQGGDSAGMELDESTEVDAAGEADIYLSLGNYDTAGEILTKALEKNPDDMSVHLKLLEMYVEKNDAAAFDEHVVKLEGVADSSAMDQVNQMRASLGASVAPVEAEADFIDLPEGDELDFDLDVAASEDGASEELDGSLDIPDSVELPGVDFDDVTTTADSTDFDDLDIDLGLSDADASESGESFDELDIGELETDLDAELDLSALETSTTDDSSEQSDESGFDLDLDLGEELELDDELLSVNTDSSVEESSVEEISLAESSAAELDLDLGEDFDMLDGSDEIGTQLELAQAYVDMGDNEGAREILDHVALKGSEGQQSTAKGILAKLG